jgi:hypothetical protein
MRRASTIAGVLAWAFLVWMFLLSMAAPHWLGMLTLGGFVLFTLTSLVLSCVCKKRLGFWLGATALVTFVVVGIVLPSM